MSVTTPASPEDIQARLKAAVACLNLSLEAELTQYRCHRLVQSLSPFSTSSSSTNTANNQPTPEITSVSKPELEATVDFPPEMAAALESITADLSSPNPTSLDLPSDSSPLTVEAAFELPPSTPSISPVLRVSSAPPAPPVSTPAATPKLEMPKLEALLPTPAVTEVFSESPTLPRPAAARSISNPEPASSQEPALPISEPEDDLGFDEVWFDLGDFQPFTPELAVAESAESPGFDAPTLEEPPGDPEVEVGNVSTPSPNNYLESAVALLENIPELGQSETQPESNGLFPRGLVIAAVIGGLVSTAGAIGFVWWQTREQPLPGLEQSSALPAPEPVSNPPLAPIPPAPLATAVEPSPPAPTTSTLVSPAPNAPVNSSQPLEKTNSAQAAVQASPTPNASPLVAPPGSSQFFYVVANYQQIQDLTQARQAIPNAYLVDFPEGVMIQFAAFEDEPSALFLVDSLKAQGIQAKVRPPES